MRRDLSRARRRPSRYRPSVVPLEARSLLSADVLTYHDDNARSSADLQETTLTPADVNSTDFGKVGFFAVDGKVDAQPLYVSNVAIPGQGVHNVVYVATENDSVYAFDAVTGAILWKDSARGGAQALLGAGETTVPATDYGADYNQITPTIGITATPVIDPATNAIYVVAMSKAVVNGTSVYYQRIHALNLETGLDEVTPQQINQLIGYPGHGPDSNGTEVVFDPRQYSDRAALTLVNGVVYTGWSSHADEAPYTGWVIGFNAENLSVASVLNVDPNGVPAADNGVGTSGGTFWNSGDGFAADASGNLYNLTGNGPFDPAQGDYGDTFLKLSTANGLSVGAYFTPSDQQMLSDDDLDLASSGVIVLPDQTNAAGQAVQLAIGSGKQGTIYVVARNAFGGYGTSDVIYQEIAGQLPGGIYGSPAYYNGTVYFGPVGSQLRAFPIANALLATSPSSESIESFGYPGTSPTISANGTRNGIVWAAANGTTAALYAYNASNLGDELYNSNQAANGRDQFGAGNKFITPMVANGHVYVATTDGVAVFGLLNQTPTTPVKAAPPTVLVPAFPSQTYTVGGMDLLGAVGADTTYGESSLTYTWSVTSTPSGAPTPALGPNGTNASKLIAQGIAYPGTYGFRVKITAPDGQSVISDVSVLATVPQPLVAVPAFASPNQAVGGGNFLGVVGTDQAFPASDLTYTWFPIALPAGATAPTLSGNGTNRTNLISVAYSKPGTYSFRVVIVNPFEQSIYSDVTVNVA